MFVLRLLCYVIDISKISFLLTGPVGCVVTGYSGGSIIISSDLKWDSRFIRHCCKKESISCTRIIHTNTTKNSIQKGRFMLYNNKRGFVTMLIRSLEPQDAGTYRMGVGIQMSIDVKLTVINGEKMFNLIVLIKLKHFVLPTQS